MYYIAIAYNRVHVLDESTSLSRTREKENKIRHRLAKDKAARTACPKNLIVLELLCWSWNYCLRLLLECSFFLFFFL